VGALIGAIALVDLDDTLFQTRRKCPPELGEEQLTALGFARDGSALSFATPRQMRFLRWLSETTHFVPVTARSLDALRRVRVRHAAAICAHGGLILDEAGAIDREWQAHVAGQAAPHARTLAEIAEAIAEEGRRRREPLSVRVLSEGGVPLYVVAKHPDANVLALNAVVNAALPDLPAEWIEHRNGNNVALLPPHLGKDRAVRHILPSLRARFPEAPAIGIGDSRTDAAFMRLCDFAMLPTGSQLAERLLDAC
jgi:hydroxymethylpyrimidine pyrophosphatase-like HAD family hydrolase